MNEQTRTVPKILAAAERQMQAWVRTADIEDRAIRARKFGDLAGSVEAYLTVSREEGAGGSEIARSVGDRLGWEVLDKELLDRVAEQFHLSRPMLELVDETPGNWAYDVLGTWMDRKIISAEKYVTRLIHVVQAAARQGSVVLVGRGSQFLLPREKGLAVRIIAPLKYRVAQVIERRQLDAAAARQWIQQRDDGRREFVQRYFHHDVDDPHLYDLVINVERLGPAGAVQQITAALANSPLKNP